MSIQNNAAQEVLHFGELYSTLLRDELYQHAVTAAKYDLLMELANTSVEQTEHRERIYLIVNAIQQIEQTMQGVISEAELIQQEIDSVDDEDQYPNI